MRLFERHGTELDVAREAFSAAAAPDVAGTLACSAASCLRRDADPCTYSDQRGRTCGVAACPAHHEVIEGQVLCSLHAATMRAMGNGSRGTALPEVDNRIPFRVSWVARDLHDGVVDLLESQLRSDDEESLLVDEVVRPLRSADGMRRWEQAWKIVHHTGMPLKVSVQVEEGSPSEIIVRVGADVIVRTTPPWFTEGPHEGELGWEAEESRRRRFYDPIHQRISEAVHAARSAGARGPY